MPPSTISQAARNAQGLIAAGRAGEAVGPLQAALRRQPRDALAHALLGLALASTGEFERAAFHAQRARELSPSDADVLGHLGTVYGMIGRTGDSIGAFRAALAADPDHLNAIEGLASLLAMEQAHAEVAALASHALTLQPGDGPFTVMLAGSRNAVGRGDEALAMIEEARARSPADADLLHARASCMNYVEGLDPIQIAAAHREHAEALMADAAEPLPPPGVRCAGPLRIGFLSGDLRAHSVAYFLEPLLRNLDRARFEPIAFCTNAARDGVTGTLRAHFTEWHDVFSLKDRPAAELIRSRDIDVLIDLCGLTAGERLGVMALRPARVQATYLGYPNTTGLRAIDWRIVDGITDPPGSEARCTETLARLDGCFVCFGTVDQRTPEPTLRDPGSQITFASFNVLSKLTEGAVGLWARIVNAVPGSVLLLKGAVLSDAPACAEVRARFKLAGLAPERLELLGWVKSDPMLLYSRVDVALDPFPYNGTTTTCEALWMGVPVVTLAGNTHAGRVGASLLTHAGLGELVAPTPDEYVRIASELGADAARLAEYRRTLRDRVRTTIADGATFARRFERMLESIAGAGA